MSRTITYTMAGDKQKVNLKDATNAELELAAADGSQIAQKELEKRRKTQ